MAFSDDTRERVRNANDIVDVIGSYLPLKRAGANFVALCPFHKEKTPSFNVNPHRQIFHCFGCHKGGDVFRFVMDYDSVVVHIFKRGVRELYGLDRIWADASRIPLRGRAEASPAALVTSPSEIRKQRSVKQRG